MKIRGTCLGTGWLRLFIVLAIDSYIHIVDKYKLETINQRSKDAPKLVIYWFIYVNTIDYIIITLQLWMEFI